MRLVKSFILYLGLLIVSGNVALAQTDSISLDNILSQVIINYPSIRKAQQDMNAADARVRMAQSAYLPDVSLNASYTRLGPSSEMAIPNMGSFELYPVDNYGASVNVNQTIYDFGKTAKTVGLENQNRKLTALSENQIKQNLSLGVVNIYYAIVYLQEAIKIKDEQLKTLHEHLSFVEKKKATGSATQYEVLTTNVRISTTENQRTDLQNALKVQICKLNSLMGQPEKNTLLVKKELQAVLPMVSTDSLLVVAVQNRPEMQLAKQKIAVSEMKYKTVGTQLNPVLSLYASGGIKDGYEPDLYEGIWNYSVGVGLRIPLFDANRTKYSKQQVKVDVLNNKEDMELSRRNIVNEVVEDQANLESSLQKLEQSDWQLKQAQQAYNLAETSYKSGVITNLELLDSSTSLSEADLSMLKSKIDYSLNLFKLKIALGQQVY